MNSSALKKLVLGVIGTAVAGVAPALLLAGAAAAQATSDLSEAGATTTVTQRDGHVSIRVEPPKVTPPIIWSHWSTPTHIVGD